MNGFEVATEMKRKSAIDYESDKVTIVTEKPEIKRGQTIIDTQKNQDDFKYEISESGTNVSVVNQRALGAFDEGSQTKINVAHSSIPSMIN